MKFKVGEKVQIINWDRRPDHWNKRGRMDKWQDTIVTIRTASYSGYSILEDQGEKYGNKGWNWFASDFKKVEILSDELFEM